MDGREYETFNDSLFRCRANPEFTPKFCDNFLASSPEMKEKCANTDIDRQNRMLKGSLYMVMAASGGSDTAKKYLAKIAERYTERDLDIEPALYEIWLESLVLTVKEVDSRSTPEVEQAWRSVLREGIKYMTGHYDS